MAATNIVIKENRKQKYYIIAFGLVLLVTVVIIWQGFLKNPESTPVIAPPPPRDVKINFALLDSDALKDLQVFESFPPFEGTKGRQNPFVSY
jgi:hypothetical protein